LTPPAPVCEHPPRAASGRSCCPSCGRHRVHPPTRSIRGNRAVASSNRAPVAFRGWDDGERQGEGDGHDPRATVKQKTPAERGQRPGPGVAPDVGAEAGNGCTAPATAPSPRFEDNPDEAPQAHRTGSAARLPDRTGGPPGLRPPRPPHPLRLVRRLVRLAPGRPGAAAGGAVGGLPPAPGQPGRAGPATPPETEGHEAPEPALTPALLQQRSGRGGHS